MSGRRRWSRERKHRRARRARHWGAGPSREARRTDGSRRSAEDKRRFRSRRTSRFAPSWTAGRRCVKGQWRSSVPNPLRRGGSRRRRDAAGPGGERRRRARPDAVHGDLLGRGSIVASVPPFCETIRPWNSKFSSSAAGTRASRPRTPRRGWGGDGAPDGIASGDRAHVLQPRHRRPRQGTARARDRRARRPDGRPRGRGGHPVPDPEPLARAGRLGAAGAVRPGALREARAGARLEATENLTLFEGMAEELLAEGGRVAGAVTADGRRIAARAVVVTTGTFLNGLMHTGARQTAGGRVGEEAARGALGLARAARALARAFQDRHAAARPPRLGRLRRLHAAAGRRSARPVFVSHASAPAAPGAVLADGDEPARPRTDPRASAREPDVLGPDPRHGPALLPVGRGQGRQVRRQDEHTIFLEPDGFDSEEIYINGLSTSLPEDVQRAILAEIPGLTRARMIRPGYAVEYDFVVSAAALLVARSARGPAPLSRRTDQRHLGLRGGGGAGPARGRQRGAGRARARRPSCSTEARPTRP